MIWTYRSQPRKFTNIKKLTGSALLLAVLLGSVTYAALQSQDARLTGNTIQTANAILKISADGTTYSDSIPGFSFNSIVPGGSAMPLTGYPVFLKNMGSTPLALKMSVTGNYVSEDSIDFNKVHVILTPVSGGSAQSFTLQSLLTTVPGGVSQPILLPAQLAANASQQFKLQVAMDVDAINGTGAMIQNLDFSFSGTAVTQ